MKKTITRLAATILLTSTQLVTPASADPLWHDGKITTSGAYEITYMAVHLADWLQTRQIARNPDKWYETNEFLGRHPSVNEVNQYFLVTGVAHAVISHYLPPAAARTWQGFTIAMQIGYVQNNLGLGIAITY